MSSQICVGFSAPSQLQPPKHAYTNRQTNDKMKMHVISAVTPCQLPNGEPPNGCLAVEKRTPRSSKMRSPFSSRHCMTSYEKWNLRNTTVKTSNTAVNNKQFILYMKREDQKDATIRCLLLTSVSTCFGHHYAHLQEKKCPVTAFGVLCSHPRTQRPTTATNHIQQNQNNTPNAVTGHFFSWRWA